MNNNAISNFDVGIEDVRSKGNASIYSGFEQIDQYKFGEFSTNVEIKQDKDNSSYAASGPILNKNNEKIGNCGIYSLQNSSSRYETWNMHIENIARVTAMITTDMNFTTYEINGRFMDGSSTIKLKERLLTVEALGVSEQVHVEIKNFMAKLDLYSPSIEHIPFAKGILKSSHNEMHKNLDSQNIIVI